MTGSTPTSSGAVTGGSRTTPGSSESRPPTSLRSPSTLSEVARQGPCYQCRLDKKEVRFFALFRSDNSHCSYVS